MEEVRKLLQTELGVLSDERGSTKFMHEQLIRLEVHYLKVTDALAKARLALTTAKAQYVLPKMGTADWVHLASQVSDLQKDVDELEGLKQAIQNRLDLGRALLV